MTVLDHANTRAMQAARKLADITGEDLASAVAVAVEERLARLQNDREARIERLVRLGLHCAEHLTGPPLTSEDIDTWLYDPHTGPPR
ncbi:MAG: type II toxin-antitoxin system VapB family antitoxin [Acetobacteraceae bacterium]|nr:type II toxin-antitoxin system VapB family antitoxin [Acetobacteraceae bacterium]